MIGMNFNKLYFFVFRSGREGEGREGGREGERVHLLDKILCFVGVRCRGSLYFIE